MSAMGPTDETGGGTPPAHRAVGHGGVLDGDDVVDRLVTKKEPARMDRQVPRKILDLVGQSQQVPWFMLAVDWALCAS